MKEYKSNEKLLEHLISKNIVKNNKQDVLEKIEKYTYYSIVNGTKKFRKLFVIGQFIFLLYWIYYF